MSEITRLLIPRAAYQNMVTMLPAGAANLAQVLRSSAGVEEWATTMLVDRRFLPWARIHALDLVIIALQAFSGVSRGKIAAICILILRASTC